MTKSNFALSWGRKIFFSAGLTLTFICGASFLAAKVFPSDVLGWIYFAVTFIGWYGLLLSASYFIFYRLFAKFLPSYYVLRFSSLIILILLNLTILFDAYLFTQYQVHLSSMVFSLIQDEYFFKAIGVTPVIWISLIGLFFIFSMIFWIQGEKIWRVMQGRFSNPTSNWYVIFFIICFVSSHTIYFLGSFNQISNYFFLPQVLQVTDFLKEKQHSVADKPLLKGGKMNNLFYPKRKLNCSKTPDYSVLFIKMDELNLADLDPEIMPHLLHLKDHGMVLENHHGTARAFAEADFSINYSIPAFYKSEMDNVIKSPLELALKSSGNQLSKLENPASSDFKEQINKEQFFLEVSLYSESKTDTDKKLYELIDVLNNQDKISQTIIIVTGKIGEPTIPVVMLWPERSTQDISKFTSHYDFIPTLLEENFHCKNKVTDYSFGSNIFSKKQPEILYLSHGKNVEIMDVGSKSLIKTDFQTISPFPKGKELPKFMMAIEQLYYFNTPSL